MSANPKGLVSAWTPEQEEDALSDSNWRRRDEYQARGGPMWEIVSWALCGVSDRSSNLLTETAKVLDAADKVNTAPAGAALARCVLEWWDDHRMDACADEGRFYTEEPEIVTRARALLGRLPQ